MARNLNLNKFLVEYPLMSLVPCEGHITRIKGVFQFSASHDNQPVITESYNLEIVIPSDYPRSLPSVYEQGGRIPREDKFHVNPDGTLCLGSILRIKLGLAKDLSLSFFASDFIVPFLYSLSEKRSPHKDFYMGELEHGRQGLLDDYKTLYGVSGDNDVGTALRLTSLKKRIANKRKCPCGCLRRLGKCKTRFNINKARLAESRSWFSRHYSYLFPN